MKAPFALILAFASAAAASQPGIGSHRAKARNCLRALEITGQVQIKFSNADGAQVLYLDSRHYLMDDLPADAEILVLAGDAQFDCGGARLDAISGTIFSAAESMGREHLWLKQGELSVEFDGKVFVLDKDRHTFSYPKLRRQAESKGFLR